MLFYETRISVDGTVSCSRCHPIGLYAADGLRKSIGNNCKVNPRNAPTLFNTAGQISAHWIGNRVDVEDQAKQAVIGPPSFGMPSYEAVEKRLKEIKGYGPLFREAFPEDKDPVTVDNFAKAVGAFERTLVTPSRFDAFVKGELTALSDNQKRGLKTFVETSCMICHSSAYVGGQMYQKFGVFEPYWQYTRSKEIDEGRYVVTKNESDKYVFKVPILRNVEMTSPYFHDGSVDHLYDAVRIMGKIQLGKDLDKSRVEEIVTFLKSLTGEIPEDALKVPLLPSTN
jgi:cytochrome c peroxidase